MSKVRLVVGAGLVALVASFEGLRQQPYLDEAAVPTVCYGYTAKVEPRWYSRAECDILLLAELEIAAEAVRRHVRVPIEQPTFDALVSFVYNFGETKFRKSTLLRKLNSGDTVGACNEFLRWNKIGTTPSRGLTTRRRAERDLCLQGT